MKKVIAFGTFDGLHEGHKNYLKQARKLGNLLVVVVARDKTVLEVKGKKAKRPENERSEEMKKSGLADEVVLGDLENRYASIEKFRPDVIALGYDQKADIPELKNKLKELNLNPEIVRLESFRPEIYKSSKINPAG